MQKMRRRGEMITLAEVIADFVIKEQNNMFQLKPYKVKKQQKKTNVKNNIKKTTQRTT